MNQMLDRPDVEDMDNEELVSEHDELHGSLTSNHWSDKTMIARLEDIEDEAQLRGLDL